MAALPFDYHTHNFHSCEASGTIADFCRHALEIGLNEIAFTDHLDRVPGDECYDFYRPGDFHDELQTCRAEFPTLTLRAGVEAGEIHRFAGEIMPMLDPYPYDVVLGSLHWVGDECVFYPEYFTAQPIEQRVVGYFEEMLAMVRHGGFDVLAHMDIFRRPGARYDPRYGKDFTFAPYKEAVRAVLAACIESGIAIEVNTSGYRAGLSEPHPNLEVLRWYKEMGGERLTVGSDAHRPQGITANFEAARDLILEAGFTRLCRFERRQACGWAEIE